MTSRFSKQKKTQKEGRMLDVQSDIVFYSPAAVNPNDLASMFR